MTMLDGNIRKQERIKASFYEETPESKTSARGLGETSMIGVIWERYDNDLLLLDLGGKRYYVPRAVLIEAMKLRP